MQASQKVTIKLAVPVLLILSLLSTSAVCAQYEAYIGRGPQFDAVSGQATFYAYVTDSPARVFLNYQEPGAWFPTSVRMGSENPSGISPPTYNYIATVPVSEGAYEWWLDIWPTFPPMNVIRYPLYGRFDFVPLQGDLAYRFDASLPQVGDMMLIPKDTWGAGSEVVVQATKNLYLKLTATEQDPSGNHTGVLDVESKTDNAYLWDFAYSSDHITMLESYKWLDPFAILDGRPEVKVTSPRQPDPDDRIFITVNKNDPIAQAADLFEAVLSVTPIVDKVFGPGATDGIAKLIHALHFIVQSIGEPTEGDFFAACERGDPLAALGLLGGWALEHPLEFCEHANKAIAIVEKKPEDDDVVKDMAKKLVQELFPSFKAYQALSNVTTRAWDYLTTPDTGHSTLVAKPVRDFHLSFQPTVGGPWLPGTVHSEPGSELPSVPISIRPGEVFRFPEFSVWNDGIATIHNIWFALDIWKWVESESRYVKIDNTRTPIADDPPPDGTGMTGELAFVGQYGSLLYRYPAGTYPAGPARQFGPSLAHGEGITFRCDGDFVADAGVVGMPYEPGQYLYRWAVWTDGYPGAEGARLVGGSGFVLPFPGARPTTGSEIFYVGYPHSDYFRFDEIGIEHEELGVVVLHWKDNHYLTQHNAGVYYRIKRSPAWERGAFKHTRLCTLTDTELAPGQEYTYELTAHDVSGMSYPPMPLIMSATLGNPGSFTCEVPERVKVGTPFDVVITALNDGGNVVNFRGPTKVAVVRPGSSQQAGNVEPQYAANDQFGQWQNGVWRGKLTVLEAEAPEIQIQIEDIVPASFKSHGISDPIVVDDNAPLVQIQHPEDGNSVSEPTVLVSGTATAQTKVTQVEVRANDGAWIEATLDPESGASSVDWQLTVALEDESNTIKARARDDSSPPIWSPISSITVYYSPPQVTDFAPTGIRVPVNTQLELSFNQDMDRNSVELAFSIAPDVPLNWQWQSDSQVTIIPTSDLTRDTKYTCLLADSAHNTESISLDGDYDGNPGGDLSWSFATPGDVIWYDDFEDGDYTSGPKLWVPYWNSEPYWSAASKYLSYEPDASAPWGIIETDSTVVYGEWVWSTRVDSTDEGAHRSVYFVYIDDHNWLKLAMSDNGYYALERCTTDVGRETLDETEYLGLDTDWHTLKVSRAPNDPDGYMAVYLDGALILQGWDDKVTSCEKFRIECVGNTLTKKQFDDFWVADADVPPPQILDFKPLRNDCNVTPDSMVQVEFDQSMDTTSVENAFQISPLTDGEFTWSNADRQMTFEPATEFSRGTTLTVSISDSAQSQAGLAFDGDYDTEEGGSFQWSCFVAPIRDSWSDDFNDGEYTHSPPWTVARDPEGWNTAAGRLQFTPTTIHWGELYTTSTTAYGEWEWNTQVGRIDTQSGRHVEFVRIDDDNRYSVEMYDYLESAVHLIAEIDGTIDTLGAWYPGWSAEEAKAPHHYKVTRASDGAFCVYVDGVERITAIDNRLQRSNHLVVKGDGLAHWVATPTTKYFDNISVSGLDGVVISAGPSGNPNPVRPGEEEVHCAVTAQDVRGEGLFYAWTSAEDAGWFDDATASEPTWTAPLNTSDASEGYELSVTVTNAAGESATGSYTQTVEPVLHALDILSGPLGDPNPVVGGTDEENGQVQLSVGVSDSRHHSISYQWTAVDANGDPAGSFDDGTRNDPVWTAPENVTGNVAEYDIGVEVTCDGGETTFASYTQSVLPVNGWQFAAGMRMIGIPAEIPGSPSMEQLLGAGRIWWWEPQAQDYVEDPDYILGHGYWMQLDDATEVELAGTAVTRTVYHPVKPGWNMICVPYLYEIGFDGLGATVKRFAWTDQGNGYELVAPIEDSLNTIRTILRPWEGYWVYADAAGVLALSPISTTTQTVKLNQGAPDGNSWQIQLVARAGSHTDAFNFCGVANEPTASVLSIANPPPKPGFVDLYFPSQAGPMACDIRPPADPTLAWDFEVRTDLPSSEVSILYPDLSPVPNNFRLVLHDVDADKLIWMRTTQGYSYESGPDGGVRHFRITAERTPETRQLITVATADQTGPDTASITYVLSSAAYVSVQIRNIAGRLIRHVQSDELKTAGINTTTWNLTNAAGSRVPAGQYLCTVTARTEDGQQVSRLCAVRLQH